MRRLSPSLPWHFQFLFFSLLSTRPLTLQTQKGVIELSRLEPIKGALVKNTSLEILSLPVRIILLHVC